MFQGFDVNLRKPFYDIELLERLMYKVDFIKFNDEEILEIASGLDLIQMISRKTSDLSRKKTNTPSICVTLGKHGSIMLWKERCITIRDILWKYLIPLVLEIHFGKSHRSIVIQ